MHAMMVKERERAEKPPASRLINYSNYHIKPPGLIHMADGAPSRRGTSQRDYEYWNSTMSETPGTEYHGHMQSAWSANQNDERIQDTINGHAHPDLLLYQQKHAKRARAENPQRLKEEGERSFRLQRRRPCEVKYLNGDGSLVLTGFNFGYDENVVSIHSQSLDEWEASTPTPALGESPALEGVADAHEAVPIKPVELVSTPTAITWNTVIGRILNSGYVDSAIVDIIQQRNRSIVLNEPRYWNDNDSVSMRQIGLVPNFSRPLVGAPFYDRFPAPKAHGSFISSTSSLKLLTNGELAKLPNGISTTSISSSHTLSNRPVTPNKIPILLSSPTSPPPSPATRITQCESIIAVETKLIQSLHKTVDGLRERNEDLEEIIIPKITHWLADRNENVETQQRLINQLLEQLADMRICIDFGNRVLSRCCAREQELWRWMGELRDKRKTNTVYKVWQLLGRKDRSEMNEEFNSPKGYESVVFNHSPHASISPISTNCLRHNRGNYHASSLLGKDIRVRNPASHRTALSRKELGVLIRFVERNIAFLKTDVAEMGKLVQKCMKNGSDGSYCVGRETSGYA